MKTIALTQGQTVLVDDEDYEELNKFKWHAMKRGNGKYVVGRSVRKREKIRTIFMAREIMGLIKGKQVFYKNYDSFDCRRQNLKICTDGQKTYNYKGFHSDEVEKRWHLVYDNMVCDFCGMTNEEHLKKYSYKTKKGQRAGISLNFHHKNSKTKRFCLVSYVNNFSISTEEMLIEKAKCIPLCKKCHSKLEKYLRFKKWLEDINKKEYC